MYNEEIQTLQRDFLNKLRDEKITPQNSLFHYTSSNGLKGILDSKTLWFSHIDYLNDEGECRYTYNLLKSIVESMSNDVDSELVNFLTERCDHMLSDQYYDQQTKGLFNTEYFLVSFSTDPDNLSNWNYYTKTKDITGYNIEFRKDELLNSLEGLPYDYIHGKTIYDVQKQKQLIEEALTEYNYKYKNTEDADEKRKIYISFNEVIKVYSLFFKHHFFEAENEYRIVFSRVERANQVEPVLFREDKGLFIPYLPREFSKESIKIITISPTEKQEMARHSIERMIKKDFRDVTVKKSEIPLRY